MWFLFHRSGKTKAVRGGRSFTEECPTCQHDTRFYEVEVTSSYGVWFVDVFGDKERAFACAECGDTFDLRDEGAAPARAPAAAMPAKSGTERVEQLAAEQRRRDAESKARRAAIETRLDDELAELKKRMGK